MHIAGRRAMLALLIASLPACAGQTVGTASTSASPGRAWTPADSASAHAAAAGFLTAFDSLQWDRFRSFLSDDITMFFPFTDAPARVDGRAAVEEAFSGFFADRVKEGAASLGIVPRLLRVQMAGADAAVVSFELGASSPSRRSVVFSRDDGADWKVLHWHASPAPQRPQTAPAGRPLSPEEIAVYEGTYLIQVGERTLEITVSGDGDHLQVAAEPNLYWVSAARANSPPLREQYWQPTVMVCGPIAVVWAPYEFWISGETSHCGVDVFSFVKTDGRWRVANAMWTVEPAACDELRPADPSLIRPGE